MPGTNEIAISRKKQGTYVTHSRAQYNTKFRREVQRLTVTRFLLRRSRFTRTTVEVIDR